MDNLKFEEFELSNESLNKITGGKYVSTSGTFMGSDIWCNHDMGDSVKNAFIYFADCCPLTSDGFCV